MPESEEDGPSDGIVSDQLVDVVPDDAPTLHGRLPEKRSTPGDGSPTAEALMTKSQRRLPRDPIDGRDWRTRITKVQVVKPTKEGGECLVLLYPPGPDMGKRYLLSRSDVVIGRDADCDIQIARDTVSRHHAHVFRVDDGWSIEDLQSTNGSYVNDVQVTKSVLRDGDFLKIGSAIFKFLAGSSIESSYHEEIYKITIMDALTGAHNKRYCLEFLEREMARCARYSRPLSLIMFAIDHFKQINDKHGRLSGDQVLRELTKRLLPRMRVDELLARYGGEEFAVVLPESDPGTALAVGEQIRRTVSDTPFEYEGDPLHVTVSVGVATFDGTGEDVTSLINLADTNLYRAKRQGRNRVVSGRDARNRWRSDPGFTTRIASRTAVVAMSLLGRDRLLASNGGAARVDDLEGLLYARLLEHQRGNAVLSFGSLEGGGQLLVATTERAGTSSLRARSLDALRACAEESPEARFAVGPVCRGASALEEAISGLEDELGLLENGRYLPQPIAQAARALDAPGPAVAKAKHVLELGEAVLQWLALCAAAELLQQDTGTKTVSVIQKNLVGPVSMGRWHETLSSALKELLEARPVHEGAWRAAFGDKSARSATLSWFNSLIALRNDFAHDPTATDEHTVRKIVDEMYPQLRSLVSHGLRPILALIPAEVEFVDFEDDLQCYRVTRLIGDRSPVAVPAYSRRKMKRGLWLCDAIADRAVPLEPFFVRDTCPKCGARELFLLSRLDELSFRNPASGHVMEKQVDALPFSLAAKDTLLQLATGVPKTTS